MKIVTMITLGSIAVTFLSGATLLAEPCRADTCSLLETSYPGRCPDDLLRECANRGAGCPAEATGVACANTDSGYTLRCCYNGYGGATCAS